MRRSRRPKSIRSWSPAYGGDRGSYPAGRDSAGPDSRAESAGPQRSRLKAKTPDDLLGVVPYLLGFHPADSVVMVLLAEREVVMTARLDIAALDGPADLATYLDGIRRSQNALGLVTITYSTDPGAREKTVALAAEFDPLILVDALLADGERWWSVLCDGPCCPAEGTAYDAGSNALSAAAVFAGMTALPDRETVRAQVAGPPPADEPTLNAMLEESAGDALDRSINSRKRLVRRLVTDALGAGPLSDRECLRLAALVRNLEVRDVAWAQLTRPRAEDHVALWQRVVSRTPAWLSPAPLCLLGMAAWVSGNGALQNCCIERVEEIDPSYSMASLLSDINQRALPPAYWDELLEEFRRHPEMLAG